MKSMLLGVEINSLNCLRSGMFSLRSRDELQINKESEEKLHNCGRGTTRFRRCCDIQAADTEDAARAGIHAITDIVCDIVVSGGDVFDSGLLNAAIYRAGGYVF